MGLRIKSEGLKASGFTLVELAIALMVIGLLIGGVLKGQELIANARITATIKQLKDYDAAVMIFRSTYNGLPGDLREPQNIPGCTSAPCNEIVAGHDRGDNLVGGAAEGSNFWRHLFYAGLITGINEDPDVPYNEFNISPKNPFGVHIYAQSIQMANPELANENIVGRLFVFSRQRSGNYRGNMAPKEAIALDRKMDDGKPHQGTVQLKHPSACYDADEKDYTGDNSATCLVGVETGSMNN